VNCVARSGRIWRINVFMAKLHGKTPAKFFGTFEYVHEKIGSRLTSFRSTTGLSGRPAA